MIVTLTVGNLVARSLYGGGVTDHWFDPATCDLRDLIAVCAQPVSIDEYPRATTIEHNTVVYDSGLVHDDVATAEGRMSVMSELADALLIGPGIVVFREAFERDVVEAVSEVFAAIIVDERDSGIGGGDHFARPGDNDRVWNALQKLALREPRLFARYYDNEMLALISHAWLGPGYQVTSQVNVVNPGGIQQQPHRDYHLGFMPDDRAAVYPAHVHRLSPMLTLQGAIAHCDMPVETGPTMYLPHSQKYGPGYVAWRRPEFKQYFDDHHVQLELSVGDAVFFNPALFHGAGTNRTTNMKRMANLLQISSALSRAMEYVDRTAVVLALYPVLLDSEMNEAAVDRVLAASAEGYPFPGDLDQHRPEGESSDQSAVDITRRALRERWPITELATRLAMY
jgi:ectoine hydroxylase-related dioxygenase (phytanoyl-CoA dioxygenase family)